MDTIIRLCDILASVLTVVSLNIVAKNYKGWLLYIFASILFVIVCAYNKIPGLTIMGVFLFGTGIRNYLIGRKTRK